MGVGWWRWGCGTRAGVGSSCCVAAPGASAIRIFLGGTEDVVVRVRGLEILRGELG